MPRLACMVWFLAVIGLAPAGDRSPLDALDPGKERELEHPKGTVAWLRGHTRAVAALAFSKDGSLLASSSWDNTLRIWKFGGASPQIGAQVEGSPSGIAFAGKMLIAGGKDESVYVWSISDAGAAKIRILAGHRSRPFTVGFSQAADLLVTGCNAPVLRVWKWDQGRAETWGILTNEQVGSVGISSLSFSHDGKLLAAGNYAGENSLRIWDVTSQGLLERKLFKTRARLVCFAPERDLLAFWAEAGPIHLWDMVGGTKKSITPAAPVRTLALSPNGELLASSHQDKKVTLWKVAAGEVFHQWQLREEVKALAFAPDGRHMAWGNEDGSIYVVRLSL